jgi:hypothetical protein
LKFSDPFALSLFLTPKIAQGDGKPATTTHHRYVGIKKTERVGLMRQVPTWPWLPFPITTLGWAWGKTAKSKQGRLILEKILFRPRTGWHSGRCN